MISKYQILTILVANGMPHYLSAWMFFNLVLSSMTSPSFQVVIACILSSIYVCGKFMLGMLKRGRHFVSIENDALRRYIIYWSNVFRTYLEYRSIIFLATVCTLGNLLFLCYNEQICYFNY